MKDTEKNRASSKGPKFLMAFTLIAFLGALAVIAFDALTGKTYDADSAAGYYYYTDVPNWQEVFLDGPNVGFSQPVLSMAFFFAWALLMYGIWVYVENRNQR